MSIEIPRLEKRATINAVWDKPPWQSIGAEVIGLHMGSKPDHIPRTQVKVAYDDTSLYLIFRVEDRYVRAVAQNHQDGVCRDSCVEFFFTTGGDVASGYFNIEMNCGGTMLFHYQKTPSQDRVEIPEDQYSKFEIAHSLPKNIDPEIKEPTTWTVEYRLPIEILDGYCPVDRPAPGVSWRANFYKCGDQTSHPHWLTWSEVDFPRPNFHLPEFFGVIEFT